MILIDISALMWSGIHSSQGTTVDEAYVRHSILNQLRAARKKYGQKYGELVICCDDKNYWRKDINPYYKGQRAAARKKNPYDMKMIFEVFDEVKHSLAESFPYKVIQVERAEADDVIGVLARLYSSRDSDTMIYSRDKDFRGLQKYPNVVQIDPVTKKELKLEEPPEQFIMRHTIIGDGIDGICNILSDIDTLMTEGKRQKSVSKKKLAEWVKMTPEQLCAEIGITMERFNINRDQVDLSRTPQYIVDEVVRQFETNKKTPLGGHGSAVLRYFMKHKMKIMTDYLEDFIFKIEEKKSESKGNSKDLSSLF